MRGFIAVLWTLSLLAFGAFFWWRSEVVLKAPPPANIAMVVDVSDSSQRDCDSDADMVLATLHLPNVTQGSTIFIARTGDPSTKGEPQVVFAEPIPFARANPIGGRRRASKMTDSFIARIRTVCGSLRGTQRSPIVKAVRRALTQLKGAGCIPSAKCLLIVHSDLEDTDELSRHGGIHPPLIDNGGIRVVMCGFSSTINDGVERNADSLMAKWRELFAEPVVITPFCSAGVL